MYNLNDTIVAVSSSPSGTRTIVRITGPGTIEICQQIFSPPITQERNGIFAGSVAIDAELKVDAKLYLFFAPHSYTGETLVEIHINANPAVTEALMGSLLGPRGADTQGSGLRAAGPGEFTARAYLNGKIDLAQAEAVNEVVVSSNKFQLAAAEKLLSGRLAEIISKVRSNLMDCLSLIEAGLDFSGEDIEFITREEAIEKINSIKRQLEEMLSSSIRYESVIDLPAVGIAGAPNAGKSSLLNRLLGQERSIVSRHRKTTRDVLTGLLTLNSCRCVLFDCAGLLISANNILEELAQQTAIEALRNSTIVVFCVDISQDSRPKTQDARRKRHSEEIGLWSLVCGLGSAVVVPVATKCDLVKKTVLADRLVRLNDLFGTEFLATSAETGVGLEHLREEIDRKLIEKYEIRNTKFEIPRASGVTLTARHRQAVTEAAENVSEAINELKRGRDEVTAMMLRAAYQDICDIEQQPIDEQILDKIFSRFCIGK